jgi:RNA recognition motif-containing protein
LRLFYNPLAACGKQSRTRLCFVRAVGGKKRHNDGSSVVIGKPETMPKTTPPASPPAKAPAKVYNTRLFVGNVPFDLDVEGLADLFDAHGIVIQSQIPTDPKTGKAIGYAFVTMATEQHCKQAIAALDGTKVKDRKIEVRFADVKEKPKKPPRAPRAPRRPAGGDFAGPVPAHLRPDADRLGLAQPIVSRPTSATRSFTVEKRRLGPTIRRP